MSHQIGASDIHQDDRDSNSVPVLGFKLPKSIVYTKARQQLPKPLGTFVVGGVSEPQAEVSRVY